jgi:hypothetical protein
MIPQDAGSKIDLEEIAAYRSEDATRHLSQIAALRADIAAAMEIVLSVAEQSTRGEWCEAEFSPEETEKAHALVERRKVKA